MKEAFYRVLVRVSRWLGLWFLSTVAAVIALGYFLFKHERRRRSVTFYESLFAGRGRIHALRQTLRQFLDFAHIYTERQEIDRGISIDLETSGDEHIQQAVDAGHGAVVLMSHFGRWEIAARLRAQRSLPMTLIMGVSKRETANNSVATAMRRAGLDVVEVREGEGQPIDILAAVNTVRSGGVVALSGDRAYGEARVIRLPFLDGEVSVPVAPFALALTTEAPLLTVFACRAGPRSYRIVCDPPQWVRAARRADRDRALRDAATAYVARLRAMVEVHPEQWHDFTGFFERPT